MKKIVTNSVLIRFFIKSILLSILSIVFTSCLSSLIVLKLDLDLSFCKYISIVIVFISSILVSFVSTFKLKNSGGLMGIISCIPLFFYEIFTLIFGDNSLLFFVIKLLIIFCTSFIIGAASVKKNRKIRL